MAGQTTELNGLKFVVDTRGGPRGCSKLKHSNFYNFSILFPRATPGPSASEP